MEKRRMSCGQEPETGCGNRALGKHPAECGPGGHITLVDCPEGPTVVPTVVHMTQRDEVTEARLRPRAGRVPRAQGAT